MSPNLLTFYSSLNRDCKYCIFIYFFLYITKEIMDIFIGGLFWTSTLFFFFFFFFLILLAHSRNFYSCFLQSELCVCRKQTNHPFLKRSYIWPVSQVVMTYEARKMGWCVYQIETVRLTSQILWGISVGCCVWPLKRILLFISFHLFLSFPFFFFLNKEDKIWFNFSIFFFCNVLGPLLIWLVTRTNPVAWFIQGGACVLLFPD